jgi:DsbC/DsbD-like thiol-disulfide interchange protein
MPALLILLAILYGAPQRPTDIVRWSVAAPGAWTTAGGTLKLTVSAKIEDGWKLYAIDQPAAGPRPLSAPPAKVLKDPIFDANTRYYEKEVAITVPVSIPADLAGIHEIPVEVTFQACGADICLRPFTQKLPVQIEVRR